MNVVNDQYDEILGIRKNKTVAPNEKTSEFMPIKARKRPMSSISKTTSAVNNIAQRTKNLRLVSATTKRENRKRLQSAKPTRRINSAFPGSRLAQNINTNNRLGKTQNNKKAEREIDQLFNDSELNESIVY